MIYATKGLKRRQFDEQTWKEMPEHKYGWTLSAEEPDEVKEIRTIKVTKEDIAKNPDLEGLEGKSIGVVVPVITRAQEIEKIENELKTPGLHHMVVKKLNKRLEELKAIPAGTIEEDVDAGGTSGSENGTGTENGTTE
ncbi:MAG: hypothetical protein QM802_19935 [Agriterribacter sp.]